MTFELSKRAFLTYQGSTVTLEKFANGVFHKYSVNNNCIQLANAEMNSNYVYPN